MHIAIQGELGSFHHQAVTRYFSDVDTIIPCNTFADVFGALNRHDTETAIVAIENSLYGSINEVYDLIETHRYPIVGEIYLRIEQQLIGLPGAKIEDITTVYSHPVALAQCEQYLEARLPDAEKVAHHDTAAAVLFVKQQQHSDFAAIAGSSAATLHGLEVLDTNIEDNKANYTRFVVISRNTRGAPVPKANKASLVVQTNHKPGSLAKILAMFADANINMTKLQSRPIVGKIWKYRFYIDVEIAGEPLHTLLNTIRHQTEASISVLGEYESDTLD